MIVEVAYGENVDPAEALRCFRCKGTGESETGYQTGAFIECPACEGSGQARHAGYAYEVSGAVEVGDLVVTPGTSYPPYHPASVATVIRLGSDYDGPIDSAQLLSP
jgi:hypothetical protein